MRLLVLCLWLAGCVAPPQSLNCEVTPEHVKLLRDCQDFVIMSLMRITKASDELRECKKSLGNLEEDVDRLKHIQ